MNISKMKGKNSSMLIRRKLIVKRRAWLKNSIRLRRTLRNLRFRIYSLIPKTLKSIDNFKNLESELKKILKNVILLKISCLCRSRWKFLEDSSIFCPQTCFQGLSTGFRSQTLSSKYVSKLRSTLRNL